MDFFEKLRIVENKFLLKNLLNKKCESKRMLVLNGKSIKDLFSISIEIIESNKEDKK
jgi:hypothetical protein